MMRIGMVVGSLLVTLLIGFGAGWLVFEEDLDDRELACAGARSLPQEPGDRWGVAVGNEIAGVGLLAQAAGSTGEDFDDLDELGRAGRDLNAIIQRADIDGYDDARRALLAAC
ncbi:hypothetical protein [Nocardioides pacificus]